MPYHLPRKAPNLKSNPAGHAQDAEDHEEVTLVDKGRGLTGSSLPDRIRGTPCGAASPRGPRQSRSRTLGSQVFSPLSEKHPALHDSGTNSSHAHSCAKPHFPPSSVFQQNLNPGITSLPLFRTSYSPHQPPSHHFLFFFFFNWSMIMLQCVSFCCIRAESALCIHTSPPS